MQEKHSFTSSGRGLQPVTLLLSEKLHTEKVGRPGTMASAGRMSQVDAAHLCHGAEQKWPQRMPDVS